MVTQKYIFVAMRDELSRPVVSSTNWKDLEKGLDEYCGATEHYGFSGMRLKFEASEDKYTDDYEGSFFYEFRDRDSSFVEEFKVYCIDLFY
jgi:hypothetical protein